MIDVNLLIFLYMHTFKWLIPYNGKPCFQAQYNYVVQRKTGVKANIYDMKEKRLM